MGTVYRSAAEWPSDAGPVVAIGNFDGVHAGHRAVLAELFALGREVGAPSCVLTFDPAPTAVLAPARHQPRICTLDDRVRLLHAAGVDHVVVEAFTPAFAARTAEDFAVGLLGGDLRVRGLVVGHDFRFGAGRAGDVAALERWLACPIREVSAFSLEGAPVSSSRVRKLVAAGEVEAAARLLGRPHRLRGRVVTGDQRGRTIGFPTANVANEVELVPAFGVYAVRAGVGGALHPAVANIGVRPTFGGSELRVEVHLLDWSGDLYGEWMEVELVARVRGERRFDGIEALVAQIRDDAAVARAVLG